MASCGWQGNLSRWIILIDSATNNFGPSWTNSSQEKQAVGLRISSTSKFKLSIWTMAHLFPFYFFCRLLESSSQELHNPWLLASRFKRLFLCILVRICMWEMPFSPLSTYKCQRGWTHTKVQDCGSISCTRTRDSVKLRKFINSAFSNAYILRTVLNGIKNIDAYVTWCILEVGKYNRISMHACLYAFVHSQVGRS